MHLLGNHPPHQLLGALGAEPAHPGRVDVDHPPVGVHTHRVRTVVHQPPVPQFHGVDTGRVVIAGVGWLRNLSHGHPPTTTLPHTHLRRVDEFQYAR